MDVGGRTARPIEIRRLGVVPYGEALELQRQLVEERRAGHIPDVLLLLEHSPVITLGVRAHRDRSHVIATAAMLDSAGIGLFESGRGGDVTYHGPGQLVGYPILDLRPDRCDVHRYVRDLEEVMIRVAARFGIAASRQPGLTGAWVGQAKLAAIGVRISRWITSHGFALNVATDLRQFDLIIPCGIRDKRVTSLEQLLGRPPGMHEVMDRAAAVFLEVFCGSTAACPLTRVPPLGAKPLG
jgi:lipoyl(octanoyl) transferase